MNDLQPIFIGGCPRSGTTMLASVLGNHDEVLVTPESQFKINLLIDFDIHEINNIEAMISYVNNNFRFKIWDTKIHEDRALQYVGHGETIFKNFILYLINEYNNQKEKKNFKYWIDHTPDNIKNAITILENFNNAKFIHIIRDGRAVANSLKNVSWGGNSTFFTSKYWTENITYGLALENMLTNSQIITTKYEDIIINPEEELRRISQFIGIDFHKDWLSNNGFIVPEYTKKQHVLVGQGLSKNRIDSWKTQMSSFEIQLFESRTYELLSYLGYEQIYKLNNIKISRYMKLNIYIKELLTKFLDRSRQKKRESTVRKKE